MIALLLVSLIVRLVSLNQSLWLDEATQMLASRDRSLSDLVTGYAVGDFHPPLYHVVLWLWFRLVPATEVMARLPSVLAGIATVWATYKIAFRLNRKIAILSGWLLALSPLHLYYSQEARMYSLAALGAVLSMWGLLLVLERTTVWRWVFYGLATLSVLGTEYVPYLLIPVQLVWVFMRRKQLPKGFVRYAIAVGLIILVLLSLWYPYFREQLAVGRQFAQSVPAWGKVVGGIEVKTIPLTLAKFILGRLPIPDDLLGQVGLGILLVLFYAVVAVGMIGRSRLFYTLWFVAPLFLGFLVALWTPIFSYFRFLFVLPALYILYARGVYLLWKPLREIAMIFALLTGMVASFAYLTIPVLQRENWRDAVAYIKEQQKPAAFYLHFPADPYRYYAPTGQATGLLGGAEDLSQLTGSEAFLLVTYLKDISDPQDSVKQKLAAQGFLPVEAKSFRGVGTVETYRKQ